ncbi:MAG: hypothetical protein LBD85_06470 [Oscillospiraceae bacterium]|jgi:hypothetical protein|nr:hypothetical protein [Oscillospiraceae bacterium]
MSVKFGNGQKFDLIQAPYGRHGSYFYIYEDYNLPILRLSGFKTDNAMQGGMFNFDIKLLQRAPYTQLPREVRYRYTADEGSVRFQQYGEAAGWGEIVLTDKGHLRIRGNAPIEVSLRARNAAPEAAAAICEGVFARDAGKFEANFGRFGKMFFEAIRGSVTWESVFDNGVCKSFKAILNPTDDTRELDVGIHEYDADTEFEGYPNYEDFDALIAANKADFENFKKNYPTAVPSEYAETAEYAKWLIWSHRVKPGGYYVTPMILMHLQWLTAAASWQQSYNAMAQQANPQEAWRQICSLFEHQDPATGQLPGMLFYSGGAGIQAPFQGFALDWIIKRCGDDFLTAEECTRMYPKFAKWVNFWTELKTAGRGDDVIYAKSPHDSGWDDASIFADGFPASNPDILAFLVVLMEMTALLARKAGNSAVADEFDKRSKRLLQTITDEFWDDESGQFVTKKFASQPVKSLSLATLQPIMLGKRLPQSIIDKVAANLTKEGEWLTPIGLASESLKSPKLGLAHQFTLGRVIAPQNMILTVGLFTAGKEAEARLIAERYLNNIRDKGMILGFSPIDKYPDNHESQAGEWIDLDLPPIASDPWPWSTWTANCFLTMASLM